MSEATQTADVTGAKNKIFFVQKPCRQSIQRLFLLVFRSHTDNRFKDPSLVGSHADGRVKSRQARGLVFCLEATPLRREGVCGSFEYVLKP